MGNVGAGGAASSGVIDGIVTVPTGVTTERKIPEQLDTPEGAFPGIVHPIHVFLRSHTHFEIVLAAEIEELGKIRTDIGASGEVEQDLAGKGCSEVKRLLKI